MMSLDISPPSQSSTFPLFPEGTLILAECSTQAVVQSKQRPTTLLIYAFYIQFLQCPLIIISMPHLSESQEDIGETMSIASEFRVPQGMRKAMKRKISTQVSSSKEPQKKKNKRKRLIQKTKVISQKPIQWLKIPNKNKTEEEKVIASEMCLICQGQLPSSDFLSINDVCEHRFCRDCLHTYIIFRVNSMQSVVCPFEPCSQTMNENAKIFAQLPEKVRKQYEQYRKFITKKSDEYLCPHEYCGGLIKMPPQFHASKKKLTCPQCGNSFCSLCFMKYHSEPCDKNSLIFFQAGLHYRQCKKCKTVVERITGCDHITCTCGYQFCYQCGQEWRSEHQCHTTPDCCYDVPICWVVFKVLYILMYTLIGYPIILFRSLVIFLVILSSALFIGLFVGPCIILQKLYAEHMCYFLLGFIFYPFLMIGGVGIIFYDMLADAGPSIFSVEIICSPCFMVARLCEEVRNRDY